MTTFQATLMAFNAFCAGGAFIIANVNWIEGKSAKVPLMFVAINFFAVVLALI